MEEVAQKLSVFLSYSPKDRDWAKEFSHQLRGSGAEVWALDLASPQESWEEALERGLRESHAVVVLVDSGTATDPNVLFELGAAMARDKAVIFVGTQNGKPKSVPVPLESVAEVQRESPASTAAEVARTLERLGLPNGNSTP